MFSRIFQACSEFQNAVFSTCSVEGRERGFSENLRLAMLPVKWGLPARGNSIKKEKQKLEECLVGSSELPESINGREWLGGWNETLLKAFTRTEPYASCRCADNLLSVLRGARENPKQAPPGSIPRPWCPDLSRNQVQLFFTQAPRWNYIFNLKILWWQ